MTTLSVHNISFRESINIHKVRYYNTQGRLVHDFVKKNISLSLMQTYQVQVSMNDTTSLGANFLVEWEGAAGVPAPLAEAVHVGPSNSRRRVASLRLYFVAGTAAMGARVSTSLAASCRCHDGLYIGGAQTETLHELFDLRLFLRG